MPEFNWVKIDDRWTIAERITARGVLWYLLPGNPDPMTESEISEIGPKVMEKAPIEL
jgi:hypothetical protein